MPRFLIVEERAYKEAYIVEAENEDEAEHSSNSIEQLGETDSWGKRILEVRELDPDEAPENVDWN